MAFDFNYVNSFKIHADPDGNFLGLLPDKDTNPAGTGKSVLGDMQGARTANVDPDLGGPQPPDEGGGFIVAFTNGSGKSGSETIYIVNPLNQSDPNNIYNIFNSAPNLLAELEFDLPRAQKLDGTPTMTPWAVGLNFKTGDQTDLGPDVDVPIGPRCQFIDGGNIRFRGAGTDQFHSGTYDGFAGTRFKLTVSLQRTATTFESGASLLLDDMDVAFIGATDVNHDSHVPQYGKNLIDARTAAAKITAIGVAVANTGQDMQGNSQPPSQVTVRLLAFRLSWDYPEIDLTRIPLIR
jgi:hypothetical protein